MLPFALYQIGRLDGALSRSALAPAWEIRNRLETTKTLARRAGWQADHLPLWLEGLGLDWPRQHIAVPTNTQTTSLYDAVGKHERGQVYDGLRQAARLYVLLGAPHMLLEGAVDADDMAPTVTPDKWLGNLPDLFESLRQLFKLPTETRWELAAQLPRWWHQRGWLDRCLPCLAVGIAIGTPAGLLQSAQDGLDQLQTMERAAWQAHTLIGQRRVGDSMVQAWGHLQAAGPLGAGRLTRLIHRTPQRAGQVLDLLCQKNLATELTGRRSHRLYDVCIPPADSQQRGPASLDNSDLEAAMQDLDRTLARLAHRFGTRTHALQDDPDDSNDG